MDLLAYASVLFVPFLSTSVRRAPISAPLRPHGSDCKTRFTTSSPFSSCAYASDATRRSPDTFAMSPFTFILLLAASPRLTARASTRRHGDLVRDARPDVPEGSLPIHSKAQQRRRQE